MADARAGKRQKLVLEYGVPGSKDCSMSDGNTMKGQKCMLEGSPLRSNLNTKINNDIKRLQTVE